MNIIEIYSSFLRALICGMGQAMILILGMVVMAVAYPLLAKRYKR